MVDQLLDSPYVDLLRRFRNVVFHYQPRFWDDRFMAFLREGEQTAAWVRQMHRALGAAFDNRIPPG